MSQFMIPHPDVGKTPTEYSVSVPTSWSLSAIGTYEKCQLKAKFKYVNRIPEARSESASRGVGIHKSVEDFLTGTTTSLPESLGHYHEWFTKVKEYEIYPEHVITLNKAWEPVPGDSQERWYKGVLDLKVVIRSEAAVLLSERAWNPDKPDVLPQPEKGPVKEVLIYDWKSGKIYPDHDDQKSLYSVAAFAEHPTVLSVRAIHVYFDLGQIREKTFYPDEMHKLRDVWNARARSYLEALASPDTLIANPGYHCRWCGYSASRGGPCRF